MPLRGIRAWGGIWALFAVVAWVSAGSQAGETVEIEIKDFEFQADTVRVVPGTEVRWVNRDMVAHTTTAESGDWGSPLLGPGETYSHVFDQAGEFAYHCTPHPYMRGVIIVEAGDSSAVRMPQPSEEVAP